MIFPEFAVRSYCHFYVCIFLYCANDRHNIGATDLAKDIGRDDSVKDGDNIASCLNKHQNHKSVVNIKALMELKKYNEFSFQNVESETFRKSLDTLKTKKLPDLTCYHQKF